MSEQKQGQESYVLTGKGEILERLRLMERQKTLISAIPDGKSSGIMTTIVKVLSDKGVVAIDASENRVLNADILNSRIISFNAQVDGITARFTAAEVSEAKLNGQQVFAVPIPTSLYWLQRRAYYRVAIPLSWQMKCRIPLQVGRVGEFDVLDMSLGGIAIQDRAHQFRESAASGTHFANCSLLVPAMKDEVFGLDLRYISQVKGIEGRSDSWRMGFAFVDFTRAFQVHLQKLIYEMELQRKEAERLVK